MKYYIVVPRTEAIINVRADRIDQAYDSAGLDPLKLDHATLVYDGEGGGGIGMFVYEYGLMEPSEHFFICEKNLYAGNAVVYAFDGEGERDVRHRRPGRS